MKTKETCQRNTANANVWGEDEDDGKCERSSSNTFLQGSETDSVSTQGSPVLVPSMFGDKLPYEYERECGSGSSQDLPLPLKVPKGLFYELAVPVAAAYRRTRDEAMLLRRSARQRLDRPVTRSTMQVTPAIVPTTEERKYGSAAREGEWSLPVISSPLLKAKRMKRWLTRRQSWCLWVAAILSGEGLEMRTAMRLFAHIIRTKFSEGTIKWGLSTGGTTLATPRTMRNPSIVFCQSAPITVDNGCTSSPVRAYRGSRKESVISIKKERCDQSWEVHHNFKSRDYSFGQFDKTQTVQHLCLYCIPFVSPASTTAATLGLVTVHPLFNSIYIIHSMHSNFQTPMTFFVTCKNAGSSIVISYYQLLSKVFQRLR
jgi:hypothetical protein